ncbi:MAG TPA: coenzyme F420-0:L-glutamate ligase [Candidatus Acidoferrum sp.]|nr:coenzyme F420-0:L-glutamate ligase [Candidatus Acidoferrum sp.]
MKTKPQRALKKQRLPSLPRPLALFVIPGLPEIRKGDNLARKIVSSAGFSKLRLEDGDIVVVAQKIVSKAEGRIVNLAAIRPSERANLLSKKLHQDPRFLEVVLRESRRIVREERVLIAETHHGFVCANAGVDHSNVPGRNRVAWLPKDPDASALRLAQALRRLTGKRIAVVISDTFGRPWRLGITNVAIGLSGVPALFDLRGTRDRVGKKLRATVLAVADELASAAGLLMQKSGGTPVVVIRGYRPPGGQTSSTATSIVRPAQDDLFR